MSTAVTPNKIKYGLCNVYYAKMLSESLNTYGTPVKIEGAVNLSLSQVGDTTAIYADNVEYFSLTHNGGYAGTIEFVLLPDSIKVDLLGEVLDANNVQTENSNASTVYFALFFQFEGDVKNKRHVLYRCRCTRPNIESSTKADKTEAKNETLSITVLPRVKDKKIKAFSTVDADESIYNRFFTGVYPNLIPALTVTSVAGTLDGDTKLTIAEAKGTNNTYVYKTAESVEFPAIGAVCAEADGWTAWDGTADITAITGNKIIIIEIDTTQKAVKAGSTTVTSKTGE